MIHYDEVLGNATVDLENCASKTADVVTGTDGLNSKMRDMLLGKKDPRNPTGVMALSS